MEWSMNAVVRNAVDGESDAGFIDATFAMLHKEVPHEQTMEYLRNVGFRKPGDNKQASRSETEYIEVQKRGALRRASSSCGLYLAGPT